MSQLFEVLKSNLNVCYLTSKKDEIVIRCPFCGDSQKNARKGHLYVQNTPPFKYFCQKCTSHGIFTENMLQQLKINDFGLVKHLRETTLDYKKKLTTKYGNDLILFSKDNFNFIPTNMNQLEVSKINYLNSRLGIQLTYDDLSNYKIILNLYDFLEVNNIPALKYITNTKQKEMIEKCQKHCIGFLSLDKSVIVFRSIVDAKVTGFRYYNFRLFQDSIDSKKFYTVKKKLDLSLSEHTIIMTEGIIDIIGVHSHLYNKSEDELFVSHNGKSFLFVLDYLASLSLLNVHLKVYSDSDVNLAFYQNIAKNSRLAKFNGLEIQYNNIEKDFGVTKDRIKLSNTFNI